MGQVRHGSATTTHAIRAAIQRSKASLATLSRELGINPKTVAKWRKRQTLEDMKTGPKEPRSTTLSEAEEATVVAFRRHTLLPLDDCLYALQPPIPHLTRSALHRCLQRHGISRLPDVEATSPSASASSAIQLASSIWTLPRCRLARISPHFPLSHGVPRVDDRRVVSGIVYVIRNGLQWKDAPAAYGPHKTLYNRFIRWSRSASSVASLPGSPAKGQNPSAS